MTHAFLLFAILTLLLRLKLLLVDRPAALGGWMAKCAWEVAAVAALLPSDAFSIAAAGVSIAANGAAVVIDRRAKDRNGAHFLLGLLHLCAWSVCFGPANPALFRPWVGQASEWMTTWSALGAASITLVQPRALIPTLGLLLAANEANLFIRWLLGRLPLRPGTSMAAGIDSNEFARGRVIGLLERVLIYFFVLNGQYGAVGFTLAAKGFTRFKELENRAFAEYVLIGTLLSSGLAIVIAVAVRAIG